MMTHEEILLYEKIRSFEFNEPDVQLSFSDRLARENGWTTEFTQQAIDEYKKFIFLCAISDQPVTPSDQVDQVWHLHLTYTRSYWLDLCRNILGKEIHHEPTKGGNEEANKFVGFYKYTFERYLEKFGYDPPKEFWFDSKQRFSDIDFKRINISKNWIIRKFTINRKHKIGIFVILFLLTGLLPVQEDVKGVVMVLEMTGIFYHLMNYRGNQRGGCGSDGCTTSCSGCGGGCSGCGGCGGD